MSKYNRRGRKGRPFNLNKAIKLYKQGMSVTQIAVRMGYPTGRGHHRTKAALLRAGIKVKTRSRKAANPGRTTRHGNPTRGIPAISGPQLLMKEVILFAGNRYRKVPNRIKGIWAQECVGMLMSSFGLVKSELRPVDVPEAFKGA